MFPIFIQQTSILKVCWGTGVKIPDNATIPESKLIRYLLVLRLRNDKSKFLAQAGFTAANPEALLAALQQHMISREASEHRSDEYGTYYHVQGILRGINGINLNIATVWLQRNTDGQFQFITLIPQKASRT